MSTRAKIHDTLERLERWLREHQPALLAAMRPGATDTELDDLERAIGRQLPDDVRAFYRWRGGSEDEYRSECPLWQRPLTLPEIQHQYEECCRFAEADWEDLGHPGWWHPVWVPIMSNDNGDFLCVDTAGVWTGVRGQIVRFWHEYESRAIEAGSLGDWLRVLVADLERGRISTTDGTYTDDARRPYGYPKRHEATEEPVVPEPHPPTSPPPPPSGAESFLLGDRVRVTEGSFREAEGEVKRLEAGTWRVTVVVIFWGRALDIDLEHWQLTLVARSQHAPVLGDWGGCEDASQLFGLLGFAVSARKLRLFTEACYRNLLGARPEADAVLVALEESIESGNVSTAIKEAVEDFWYEVGIPSDAPENFGGAIQALLGVVTSHLNTLEALAP
ncbi:transcription antitermination protein NusG [Gemmata sp. SH-PL17]|uniref:SMI1/KNR4 family protein n=1 Tax=Gemmata sp. SH-PL17 TaxID=1630693 RepID=UPI00078B4EF1|nr:SMI1/KNR4 family protein [Gemmata sp. SH-PL17]AMV23308.1 transcription antitermination protein NusG [Gemmata sp. SH-PL17]